MQKFCQLCGTVPLSLHVAARVCLLPKLGLRGYLRTARVARVEPGQCSVCPSWVKFELKPF